MLCQFFLTLLGLGGHDLSMPTTGLICHDAAWMGA